MKVAREIADANRLDILKKVARHVFCKAKCNRAYEACNQRRDCRYRALGAECVDPTALPESLRREVSILINGFHEGN